MERDILDKNKIQKIADELGKVIIEIRTNLIGYDADIEQLYRLSILVEANISVLCSGIVSDLKAIKVKLTGDIQQIADICNRLVSKPGVFAPINFVYIKHHYQKLWQIIQSPSGSFANQPVPEPLAASIKIPQSVLAVSEAQTTTKKASFRSLPSVNDRHKAILALFNTSPSASLRLKRIKAYFSEYSARTLRKDLSTLVRLGYLRQEGFGRGSEYTKLQKE